MSTPDPIRNSPELRHRHRGTGSAWIGGRIDALVTAMLAAGSRGLYPGSPSARVRHRRPRLLRRECRTLLQQFDGYTVGRAHKRHVTISRRSVDRDAAIHQPLTGLINVVHAISDVAEIATTRILLRVPVVGQFDHWRPCLAACALFV